jgi:hypothetical protein
MKRVRSHSAWTLGAKQLLSGLVIATALALAGCGGSSMNPAAAVSPSVSTKTAACSSSSCGTAVVSLTDAPGDFVSYIVTVDSLTLTRADGTVVQTVPTTSQVDFAQLVNLSEVLSAQQLPPGNYTSAQLTLDYSNADVVVSTANGNVTVPTADLINGATNSPISGPITVTLSFGSTPLVITDGTVSNLALDFNLAASNTVDLTANPITVTVNPVLSASLAPASSKQIHVRGPLQSVSAGNSDYVVNVLPFDDDQSDFGQFTVYTNASTTFLINGTSYTGSAGLSALQGLSTGTLTTAYGAWDTTTNTFTASVVHAGTSVAGVSGPTVLGTVAARTADTITLDDALVLQPPSSGSSSGDTQNEDDLHFTHQVTVTVGSGTMVSAEGETGTFSTADLSVGQRVRFTGTLSSNVTGTSLDATSGTALIKPTRGTGLYIGPSSGAIAVNLQSLGGVDATSLLFTGTGSSAATDATASNYEVGIPGSFSTSVLSVGLPVEFTGFVTPFGAAPPDFEANTVVSYAQAHAQLHANWTSPGTTTAFTALSSTALVIGQPALASATTHTIEIGDSLIDASTLSGGVTLVPATATSSSSTSGSTEPNDDGGEDLAFAIAHQSSDSVDTFGTFSDFTSALNTDLSSASVLGVWADGLYGPNGTITVNRVYVVLNN